MFGISRISVSSDHIEWSLVSDIPWTIFQLSDIQQEFYLTKVLNIQIA
jgi:hypothetical protein